MTTDIRQAARILHDELKDYEWFKRLGVMEFSIIIQISEETPRWMVRKIPNNWCGFDIKVQKVRDFIHFY